MRASSAAMLATVDSHRKAATHGGHGFSGVWLVLVVLDALIEELLAARPVHSNDIDTVLRLTLLVTGENRDVNPHLGVLLNHGAA